MNFLISPPDRVPARVTAGDTVIVRSTGLLVAYPPADGYSVSWLFAPAAGGNVVTVAAVQDSDAWKLTVPASTTASWAAGRWRWSVRVNGPGGFAQTVEQDMLTVLVNPATNALDSRTAAQRALDAIDAALEGRAGSTALEYEFPDGRRIRHMTHADLLPLRKHYAALVAAEKRVAKGKGAGRVLVGL